MGLNEFSKWRETLLGRLDMLLQREALGPVRGLQGVGSAQNTRKSHEGW